MDDKPAEDLLKKASSTYKKDIGEVSNKCRLCCTFNLQIVIVGALYAISFVIEEDQADNKHRSNNMNFLRSWFELCIFYHFAAFS